MMKKILLFFFIILLLIVIGVGVFIATFDAEQYRPLMTQKLEEFLGKPVSLGRISLVFSQGIALEIQELQVYPDAEKKLTPFLAFDSANAVLELSPLLQRDVQVQSFVLKRPYFRLEKDAQGNIRGFENIKKPSQGGQAASAVIPFLVRNIKIEKGHFEFKDFRKNPPLELSVGQVDASLKDVAWGRSIPFEIEGAVFSSSQNVKIDGEIDIGLLDQSLNVSVPEAKLDLASLNLSEAAKVIPQINRYLETKFSGQVTVRDGAVKVDRLGLSQMNAKVYLENGSLQTDRLPLPLNQIHLEAAMEKLGLRLEKLNAQLGEGQISVVGKVLLTQPQSQFEIQANLTQFPMISLQTDTPQGEPVLHGNLSVSFQGNAPGTSWPVISQTLSGQGQVTLENPVLENFNFPREMFRRLSMIPGLVDRLWQRLPPEYQKKLEERDTYFNPIQFPVFIQNGIITVDQFVATADTFMLTGAGQAALDGRVQSQVMFRTDPQFSAALIRSVEELQYLADREGRLQIPVTIQGIIPNVKVTPDLQFIASRLAIAKTQDVIGDWLQSRRPQQPQQTVDPNAPQGSTATPQQQQSQTPQGGLLGQLLQQVLQPQTQSTDNSQ